MTNLLQQLHDFHRVSVGFDDIFNRLHSTTTVTNSTGYPPYNIIQNEENNYSIEVAVAGFTQEDLDVTLHKGLLSVTGEIKAPNENNTRRRGNQQNLTSWNKHNTTCNFTFPLGVIVRYFVFTGHL